MKITIEQVKARIVETEYQLTHDTLTLCFATLDNGFVIVGKSACIDPHEFNGEIGRKVAYDDAVDQLWPYLGFLAVEDAYRAHQQIVQLTDEESEQRLTEFYGR